MSSIALPPHAHTTDVAGVPVVVVNGFDSAVAWVLDRIRQRRDFPDSPSTVVRFVNAYTLALASRNHAYRTMLASSGVNIPDGTPVAWYARRTGRLGDSTMAFRHRGPDVFLRCMDCGRDERISHFFLGSTEANLAAATQNASKRFPGIRIVGTWAPPFVDSVVGLADEAVQRINATKPDVVWVAIGTPKQDELSSLIEARCSAMFLCVGAAVDYLAGSVAEAPVWMQSTGLEWVFRLVAEPRRLWRRYLFGSIRFIVVAELNLWLTRTRLWRSDSVVR